MIIRFGIINNNGKLVNNLIQIDPTPCSNS